MILFFVRRSDLSYDTARISDSNNIRRYILIDYAARSYYRIITYRNTRKDTNVCTEPNVIPDLDRKRYFQSLSTLFGVDCVSRSREYSIGRDKHIVAKFDFSAVQNGAVVICVKVFSH